MIRTSDHALVGKFFIEDDAESRVEAIHHGAWVRVRWHHTGWQSMLPLGDVVRVRRHLWHGIHNEDHD